MISLARYLGGNRKEEATEALQRMVRLMLQALILHRVEGDPADDQRFRGELESVSQTIETNLDPKEIFFVTGSTIKTIEEHSRQLRAFLNVRAVALQNMLHSATETITTLTSGCERSTRRLQDLEAKIQRTAMIEDIQTLKVQLTDCLAALQEEMLERKAESAKTVQALDASASAASRVLPVESNKNDPVTGLPGIDHAQLHLESLSDRFDSVYVVVFVMNRIQSINNRYGYGMGDRVIQAYLEYLTQQLSFSDALFRWRGPALTAILERDPNEPAVRHDMMRIGAARLEANFDFETRKILLPISASWTLLHARGCTVDALLQKVAEFVQACMGGGSRS